MMRIRPGYSAGISEAFALFPEPVRRRIGEVDFFCGVDPVWAGLEDDTGLGDGRDIREWAHCCYPWHTTDRTTTIVLPKPRDAEPWVVVHELAHVLDYRLGFQHVAAPVNAYAQTNRQEAFAEAVTAHFFWYGDWTEAIAAQDHATAALFRQIGLVA